MAKDRPYELVRVSPSMIRSVFAELKDNGYSDRQILALSDGLMRMADIRLKKKYASHHGQNPDEQEVPEDLEALCAAGLPRQL